MPSKTVTSGFFTANCKNKIYDWIEKPNRKAGRVLSQVYRNQQFYRMCIRECCSFMTILILICRMPLMFWIVSRKISLLKKKQRSLTGKNFELYIRCDEAEATPILDTALSYFTENNEIRSSADFSLIKIYLIDEAKRSADYLFARHPLFYPLTLPKRNANEIEKSPKYASGHLLR